MQELSFEMAKFDFLKKKINKHLLTPDLPTANNVNASFSLVWFVSYPLPNQFGNFFINFRDASFEKY